MISGIIWHILVHIKLRVSKGYLKALSCLLQVRHQAQKNAVA